MGFLSPGNRETLIAELTADEKLMLVVYDDATGKPITKGSLIAGHPTIGIGRALDVNGITRPEALYLLDNDIDRVQGALLSSVAWLVGIGDVRQRVLVEMGFQMGAHGVGNFQDMMRALYDKRFDAAAAAMEASDWYRKFPARAERLVAMMRSGDVPKSGVVT